jgi:hypothetical protein
MLSFFRDSTKKMQIVDQIVNMNKSPEEVSRNNRNIPLIFIFQWLKEAGGHARFKVQGHRYSNSGPRALF